MDSTRAQRIQQYIDERLQNNDVQNVTLQILILNPNCQQMVENLLTRNNCIINTVDSIGGCWNQNDDWYEVYDIPAIIEFCGVYPTEWNINDVALLEDLYLKRQIYIQVMIDVELEDGSHKWIPNR